MNKNTHRYTHEITQYIKEKAGDLLYFFGYVDLDDNPTGYFKFEKHSEENLKRHYGFVDFNKQTTKYVLGNLDIVNQVQIGINDKSEDLREKFGYHVSDYVKEKLKIEID